MSKNQWLASPNFPVFGDLRQNELERQKLELEALKKRPTGTTVIQQGR